METFAFIFFILICLGSLASLVWTGLFLYLTLTALHGIKDATDRLAEERLRRHVVRRIRQKIEENAQAGQRDTQGEPERAPEENPA